MSSCSYFLSIFSFFPHLKWKQNFVEAKVEHGRGLVLITHHVVQNASNRSMQVMVLVNAMVFAFATLIVHDHAISTLI
ncbi:hypothetical protein P8452_73605 [Trifolium repens]|nr:hypothetical protein P8452_73605 [Trifolium repens]